MRAEVPGRNEVSPNTPLRLSVAAALAFADGSVTAMHGCDTATLGAGDVFVIETPGGGGFGGG